MLKQNTYLILNDMYLSLERSSLY